jgi:phenylalanyl-tRNA synthetase beta chain
MKISADWVREFVKLEVDDRKLAEELTLHGVAVEGITRENGVTVYDVEFTTNRPDAMNHYGVARECSAIYDVDLKPLVATLPAMAMAAVAGAESDPRPEGRTAPVQPFSIVIDDERGCARYTARIVRDVMIGASPDCIAQRLQSVEQRPINNVADASNYVLWEMGHPTHAFDLDLLEGGQIIVRRARAGEVLRTLDGIERQLSPEDLIIADARKPVGLAGVMGGFDTMITERTRNVLVESAWFDPVSVRKTAKRHNLHSDAAHRFERGADFSATPLACARVVQLILESAGGRQEGSELDPVARPVFRPTILLRYREVERILGKSIAPAEIESILRRLGFLMTRRPTAMPGAAGEEPAGLELQLPSWRLDIEREIDVIEEIARVHGYENFPGTLPVFAGAVNELPDEKKAAKLRQSLLGLGYHEAISWTFWNQEEICIFSPGQPLVLENPVSEEAAALRTSLLPGMLEMLAWNFNHGNENVRLFETGHVYSVSGGGRVDEQKHISLGASGNAEPALWARPARPYSFFDMKGDLEELLAAFSCRTLYFDEHAAEYFHPGRSARVVIDGLTVAQFGQLHPDLAAAHKLRQEVYLGEIQLDRLYRQPLRKPHYRALPRFPAVDRDFSFIFDDGVSFARMKAKTEELHIPELVGFAPAEIFRGGAIPASKYSLLLRARFQSPARTLTDDEVAGWARQIVQAMESLGGSQRA